VASVECASTLSREVFCCQKSLIPPPTTEPNKTPRIGIFPTWARWVCVVAEEDSDEKGFKRQPPSEKEEQLVVSSSSPEL